MECAFRGNGTKTSFVLPEMFKWEYPAHTFASVWLGQGMWQEISRWQAMVKE
jgi:hypothetical protein